MKNSKRNFFKLLGLSLISVALLPYRFIYSATKKIINQNLTDEQKDVFRTFAEINQSSIINQAAIRQDFIDQSQSLNIMVSPDMPTKTINKLLIDAWKLGVKLYTTNTQ